MDITIIIPVLKYSDSVNTAIDNAYEMTDHVIISTSEECKSQINTDKKVEFVLSQNNDMLSYQQLINVAVDRVDTEYFSILDVEDSYSANFFKNVELYHNGGYHSDIYMPLCELIDEQDKKPCGFANECVWANSFSENIGYLDLNSSMEYIGFNFNGAVFNTNKFIECGKLKTSMKALYWHEFLLRALNEKLVIFVVPKIGYKYVLNQRDYVEGMTEKEYQWWFDLSKNEYLFKKDRNKTYE